MNVEEIRNHCMSLKGTTESFPFDETSLVFKVMGKMYALLDLESANYISLKCEPTYAIELREKHNSITGAYHFNKKYWNGITLDGDVNDTLLSTLINHSYNEVIKKFTKKMRAEYDAMP